LFKYVLPTRQIHTLSVTRTRPGRHDPLTLNQRVRTFSAVVEVADEEAITGIEVVLLKLG
jgi:hypothetical protein